jgi:hypothetical protein
MVVRKGDGCRRLPAGLEKIGEIFLILSSSKLEACLPQLSSADLAATLQPPSWGPSFLLWRKLDVASRPSGLVPGGLAMAAHRGGSPKGSLRAACSRSSAVTPEGRRRSVAEAPKSSIALFFSVVGCFL